MDFITLVVNKEQSQNFQKTLEQICYFFGRQKEEIEVNLMNRLNSLGMGW